NRNTDCGLWRPPFSACTPDAATDGIGPRAVPALPGVSAVYDDGGEGAPGVRGKGQSLRGLLALRDRLWVRQEMGEGVRGAGAGEARVQLVRREQRVCRDA